MLQTLRMLEDRMKSEPPNLSQRPVSRARPPSSGSRRQMLLGAIPPMAAALPAKIEAATWESGCENWDSKADLEQNAKPQDGNSKLDGGDFQGSSCASNSLSNKQRDDTLFEMEKNSRVWCRTSSGNWMFGILQSEVNSGSFLCNINNKLIELELKDILPANPDVLEGVDDLIQLSYLNEPAVLHNLKFRYHNDMIYTKAGPLLIAVNPFKKVSLYSPEFVQIYRQKATEHLDPHVYAVADSAYTALVRDGINQSVIISGESGAGKTETAKIAMQYIAVLGGGRGVENEILQTNPLLEAFGNAKTLRNDNSSRFGKLIDIHFDEAGSICGAKIQTCEPNASCHAHLAAYLSRVVDQANGERSYHIFYQLCAGADPALRECLNLKNASDYCYLNRSGCLEIDTIDDAEQFRSMMNAMDVVRISKEDQKQIFEMLAAVLWIGNITFSIADNENHVTVDLNEAVLSVASLLRCEMDDLLTALCTRHMHARGEVIIQRLTQTQANDSRDALAKAIYASLFDWLVENINKSLEVGKASSMKFISILDIYGFESFNKNSFEQLCINYANERLQQYFNHHLFKIDQEEYTSEGIDWRRIDFVDNQECLDLIEKRPLGLITLLDEECNFPKATEVSLAMKLNEHLKGNTCFKAERPAGFSIHHYAGEVTYDTSGFLEKNRDLLHTDLLKLLGSCRHHLARGFAAILGDKGKGNGIELQKRSVSTKFKSQLFKLMERLETTNPHFVRCIKPNSKQQPNLFDSDLVLQQLRCCGVLEVVRISRSGYPTRYSYQYFAERYGFLISQTTIQKDDYLNICLSVLKRFSVSPDAFQVGVSKLFFRPGQIGMLEHFRTRTLNAIVHIQKGIRGNNVRCRYRQLRKATIYLQSLVRGRKARMSYEDLKLAYRSAIKIQKGSRGMLARKRYRNIRTRWLASIVIQKHARGFLSRWRYSQHKQRHGAAIVIQKYFRGFLHARTWSKHWKQSVSSAITLQKYFRRALERMKYARIGIKIILIQAVVRGWLCRRQYKARHLELRKAESLNIELSEDDGEYVNVSSVDLDMEVSDSSNSDHLHVEDKNVKAPTPTGLFELQKRLLETEKGLCKKEDENAELLSRLRLYESRWAEYETKMGTVEEMWQKQMISLQLSLEAAKKSLVCSEPIAFDTKQNGLFELQVNPARHRAARPILPHDEAEDFDWDDNTSVGTRTPEHTPRHMPQLAIDHINREIDAGKTVVDHLVREFEHRSQVFNDDVEFIVEVKSGEVDANLEPDVELRKLKQRFDMWKKDFKVQLREAKMLLQRLEVADKSRKKWWAKK